MRETQSIGAIKGVGEKTEKLFRHVGINTVGELIRYYPRGFEIFDDPIPISEAEEGRVCTVAGSVFGRIQVSGSQRVQSYHTLSERSDRDDKSHLVPYALP